MVWNKPQNCCSTPRACSFPSFRMLNEELEHSSHLHHGCKCFFVTWRCKQLWPISSCSLGQLPLWAWLYNPVQCTEVSINHVKLQARVFLTSIMVVSVITSLSECLSWATIWSGSHPGERNESGCGVHVIFRKKTNAPLSNSNWNILSAFKRSSDAHCFNLLSWCQC